MVGTMIEIPRAALTADEVAKEAEFFSFGTNDLTQTTMGLSRDDYHEVLPTYETRRSSRPIRSPCSIRKASASWSKMAVEAGRKTRPDLESRHLRRARRRAEFGRVLLPGRHELRFLLAVPCADRAAGGGAGGAADKLKVEGGRTK